MDIFYYILVYAIGGLLFGFICVPIQVGLARLNVLASPAARSCRRYLVVSLIVYNASLWPLFLCLHVLTIFAWYYRNGHLTAQELLQKRVESLVKDGLVIGHSEPPTP